MSREKTIISLAVAFTWAEIAAVNTLATGGTFHWHQTLGLFLGGLICGFLTDVIKDLICKYRKSDVMSVAAIALLVNCAIAITLQNGWIIIASRL